MTPPRFSLYGVLLALLVSPVRAQPGEDRAPEARPTRRGPAAVERYLRQLEEKDPEETERLRELRRTDPAAFRDALREKAFRKTGRPRKEGLHEGHPLRKQLHAVRTAETSEAREAAIVRLREQVAQRVDRHFEERERAIAAMREKLSSLEDKHEAEKANRAQVIDTQVEKLLRGLESDRKPERETRRNRAGANPEE